MAGLDLQTLLMLAALLLCPAAGSAAAIAGAVSLNRQKSQSKDSTGNTVAIVILSLLGAGLLILTLGVGACYGILGLGQIQGSSF